MHNSVLWFITFIPFLVIPVVFFDMCSNFTLWMLPIIGIIHLAGTLSTIPIWNAINTLDSYFFIDYLGGWILLIVSILFFICSLYIPFYLLDKHRINNKTLILCCLGFLGLASLLVQAHNIIVILILVEATTLVTIPLIYINLTKHSIEAAWKYIVICIVGVALALFGTLFVAYSAQLGGLQELLLINHLVRGAIYLSKTWLRAGFILLLVGYGTKIGLAPLHTWKPDVYGEVPGVIGALMAGGVTSCAFLALMRFVSIMLAAGDDRIVRILMISIGILSMCWAMIFMVRQFNIKRLLAYSSVEQMGIVSIGIGIGGKAACFALFHLMANVLIKSMMFISISNIENSSNKTSHGIGSVHCSPVSSWLLFFGFLAITGTPPFVTFTSEFNIALAALAGKHIFVAVVFLILLGLVFIAMSYSIMQRIFGTTEGETICVPNTLCRENLWLTMPLMISLIFSVIFGLWFPDLLMRAIQSAAALVEGRL